MVAWRARAAAQAGVLVQRLQQALGCCLEAALRLHSTTHNALHTQGACSPCGSNIFVFALGVRHGGLARVFRSGEARALHGLHSRCMRKLRQHPAVNGPQGLHGRGRGDEALRHARLSARAGVGMHERLSGGTCVSGWMCHSYGTS
jgi:hypothetical protein